MIQLLLKKDALLLIRSLRVLISVMFFAFLLVVVASFAFRQPGLGASELRVLLPGVFWMVFLFVATVTFHQLFDRETENSALVGLLLQGIAPELVYLSKFFSIWIFLSVVQILVISLSIVFLGVGVGTGFCGLCLLSLLISFGIAALGTLFATISMSLPGRELLLPVLLFPFSLPLLLAAVSASQELIQGQSFWQLGFPLVLISVFDVVSLVISLLVFEPLILD